MHLMCRNYDYAPILWFLCKQIDQVQPPRPVSGSSPERKINMQKEARHKIHQK